MQKNKQMKTFLLFLLYLCLLSFHSFVMSQENLNIDSLKKELDPAGQDTAQISLLIKLSKNEKDSVLRYSYAKRAIKLSEKLNDKKYLGLANKNQGDLLYSYKQYAEAIPFYTSAIAQFKQINDSVAFSAIQYALGTVYYRINDFQESLNLHEAALKTRKAIIDTNKIIESEGSVAVMLWRMGRLSEAEKHYGNKLDLSREIDDIQSVGSALNSLGAIFWGNGKFEKAFSYFEKALKIVDKTGNKKKYVLIINNIGLIYQEWGKNDKALKNYKEGLKIAVKEAYLYGEAYSYSNIGKIYLLKNENEKALLNFDSALVNYIKISKKIGIAYTYRNMGDAYLGMKDFDRAIDFYKLAIETARVINSKQHFAKALSSLGNAYFVEKKYLLAKKAINQSLVISTEQDYKDITKDNYFLLSKIYEMSGEHAKSLYFYKKASLLKDNILNTKNSKQIAEMQIKYETEKSKHENEVLRKEEQLKTLQLIASKSQIQKQNILIFSFAGLLIIFGVFAFLLYKSKRKVVKSTTLLTKQNEEIKLQKEELSVKSENLKEINVLLHGKTKQLEEAVQKLEKATAYKNKMFSIIGHDLRGPVGTISSIISLAMDERLSGEKRKKLLASTKDSAVATFNLLENLLIWANNEQGNVKYQPESLQLDRIVKENIELLKETLNKKTINVTINIDKKTSAYADFNTVDAIFRNLLSNAIKFTKPNGEITISAKKLGQLIEISVIDNGIGIKPEEIKKILDTERYFSSQGTGGEKGSGLGLQLCFEFIRKNKGTYNIKSTVGKGTSFIFNLPCSKGAA